MPIEIDISEHGRIWDALRVTGGGFNAQIRSDLVYMPVLEDGHSSQAPDGMVGPNINAIQDELVAATERAIERIEAGVDPDRALAGAVNEAALFGLREIVVDTPIDTGRARANWEVELSDGRVETSTGLGLAAWTFEREG